MNSVLAVVVERVAKLYDQLTISTNQGWQIITIIPSLPYGSSDFTCECSITSYYVDVN